IVLVVRRHAIAVQRLDSDRDRVGRPLIERNYLAVGRGHALRTDILNVAVVRIAVVAPAAIQGEVLEGEVGEDRRGAAEVILMVMTDDLIIDFRDPELVQIRQLLLALLPDAVVEQDRFSVRRDEDGTITLT